MLLSLFLLPVGSECESFSESIWRSWLTYSATAMRGRSRSTPTWGGVTSMNNGDQSDHATWPTVPCNCNTAKHTQGRYGGLSWRILHFIARSFIAGPAPQCTIHCAYCIMQDFRCSVFCVRYNYKTGTSTSTGKVHGTRGGATAKFHCHCLVCALALGMGIGN